MKREETLKVLDRILQQRKKDMEALQTAIDGLRIAIAEVERATDDAVTTPQKGTYKQELTDTLYGILFEYGPLHRNAILEKVKERGLHVGGGISTVGSYLSVDDRFKNVGKGVWTLVEEPMTVDNIPDVPGRMELEADDLPF